MVVNCLFCSFLFAQGPLPDAPAPVVEASSNLLATPAAAKIEAKHRFLDKENQILFAATIATSAADFAVTRANLQSGGRELNPLVRLYGTSTAGLAMNFVAEDASVIGISYFFHRTGHHKLERIVSFVNIGSSSGAVVYGLTHR